MSLFNAEHPRLSLAAFVGLSRTPFLVLTPICVALGWASASLVGASLDPLILMLVLIGALSAHVAVNALNEYEDFRSGLDLRTERTPFSGGSGTLPSKPELAPWAKRIGYGALLLTIAIGVFLIPKAGYGLVPLGLLGVLVIYTYTRWINRFSWLCLVAPGIGFGLLMVLGTHMALSGQLDGIAWKLGLIPFFLVNNLLLLNQFPDIEADRSVGRRTLPIVYGERFALRVYLLFGVLTYAWVITGWLAGWWPVGVLAALLTAPLLFVIFRGLRDPSPKMNDKSQNRQRYLGLNLVMVLLTPVLITIGIIVPV
jgi:1,4-dihydroxy-2-naphthoate polyprenyltransferase